MIKNNLRLLDDMMEDLKSYDGELGPGPYWLANQENTINWLKGNNLANFRQYDPANKALSNFSGGGYWPNLNERVKVSNRTYNSFLFRLTRKLKLKPVTNSYNKFMKEQRLPYNMASLYAQAMGRLIVMNDPDNEFDKIDFYVEDQPSDVIRIKNKDITPISAEKFLLYRRIKGMLDIDNLSAVVEIGPGAGQLNEIIAKAHPKCKQFLIDIPPQLYVTEAFMTAIFGGDVMSYAFNREEKDFTQTAQRIYPMSPWVAEQAKMPKIDLFISQIFEEMSHETVAGYIELAQKWDSKYIFVSTILTKHGNKVFSPEQYEEALQNYDLIVRQKSMPDALPTSAGKTNPSFDLLFKRKS